MKCDFEYFEALRSLISIQRKSKIELFCHSISIPFTIGQNQIRSMYLHQMYDQDCMNDMTNRNNLSEISIYDHTRIYVQDYSDRGIKDAETRSQ
jgi:hypothetical protein